MFRVVFDSAVTNVDISDFKINGTSTASVIMVTAVGVNQNTYDVTISGGDLAVFTGDVGLDLNGTQNITDLAGNAL